MTEEKNEVKTAWQLAQEKLKDIKYSSEDLARQNLLEQGRRLAVGFLRDGSDVLKSGLERFHGTDRQAVAEGAQFVFLHNLILPGSGKEYSAKETVKVLEGVRMLKSDKKSADEISRALTGLMENYSEDRNQNLEMLKKSLQGRFEKTKRAVESQLGMQVDMDIESHPEFQKEWKRLLAHMDQEYSAVLEELKQRLEEVA